MATTNDLKNGMVLNLDGAALDRRRVPARQARQGRRVRPDQAQERALRQGRRQDLQRRHQGRDRQRRQARDAVPRTRTATTSSSWTPRPTTRCTSPGRRVGDAANYLLENIDGHRRACTRATPLYVELPAVRRARRSTYTEPGLQGDRSTGGTKPATLETGARDPGAAVHHHRREGQGRHPRRATTSAGSAADCRLRAARPASAPSTSSSRPTSAGADPPSVLAERRRARRRRRCNEYTVRAGRGRRGSTATRIDELIDRLRRRLDARPDARGRPQRAAAGGAYELLWRDDVPDAVVIDEAVELATALSTDDSPAFVNGLLGPVHGAQAVPDALAALRGESALVSPPRRAHSCGLRARAGLSTAASGSYGLGMPPPRAPGPEARKDPGLLPWI